jgi:predicted ester cyclase
MLANLLRETSMKLHNPLSAEDSTYRKRTPRYSLRRAVLLVVAASAASAVIAVFATGLVSIARAESGRPSQYHESNKGIIKSPFSEVWNKHDRAAIDGFIAPGCIFYMGGTSENETGPKWYRDAFDRYIGAFPDMSFTLDEPISQDDRVTVYWRGNGTQRGTFMGIAPTNKKIHIEGIMMLRIRDRKVVEFWEQYDALAHIIREAV